MDSWQIFGLRRSAGVSKHGLGVEFPAATSLFRDFRAFEPVAINVNNFSDFELPQVNNFSNF